MIVIKKLHYHFKWGFISIRFSRDVVVIDSNEPDCPEQPVKKKQKRKHPKTKKVKTKEVIRQAALPNEERRKAFSVEFQKGREYNKKVKRISTPDIDEKEGE